MSRLIIGIDPGRKGAIVGLYGDSVVGAEPLPYDEDGLSGARLVGAIASIRFKCVTLPTNAIVVVERAQSMPGQGVSSMFKYGRDYGRILGVLEARGWSYVTVPPATWHRVLVGGSGDDPKARTRAVVEARLPDLELVMPGCRKPHEGIVDAAAIALYAQQVYR